MPDIVVLRRRCRGENGTSLCQGFGERGPRVFDHGVVDVGEVAFEAAEGFLLGLPGGSFAGGSQGAVGAMGLGT